MNKLWISIVLLVAVLVGGVVYNSYLGEKTDEMLKLADEAYQATFTDVEKSRKIIDEIDGRMEEIGVLMSAFTDMDIINDAKESVVNARALSKVTPEECRWGIELMKEKISHIKNTTKIKWKYIL